MRQFILGTDWWTDCDDAAALRILARAVLNGEADIRCIGINACMEYSVRSIVSFLHLEGLNGIPVGLDHKADDFGGNPPYQKRLAEICGSDISNSDAPDAAELYIETLRNSDKPLEIIEIGYPQVLNSVLKAEPELFAEKVSHIWMMAGKWDVIPSKENNFARNERSRKAAHELFEVCPVPITFLGWEIADKIIVGSKLADGDPLKNVFADHGSLGGRSAWDPMLAFLALNGSAEDAGFTAVCGKASVDPETGENYFAVSADGKHRFVKKIYPDEKYRDEIDRLISSEIKGE